MDQIMSGDREILITDDTIDSVIQQRIEEYKAKGQDDAFVVVDLSDIITKYAEWKQELPRVHAFYAVKCNHDPVILEILASQGAGFDCCSKGEFQKVLRLKVPGTAIIYANPCKPISHLKSAKNSNISMMTFDNEAELHKIHEHFPEARLILRIRPEYQPEFEGRSSVNLQYGVTVDEVSTLLIVAKRLELNVDGISFHPGSDKHTPSFFGACIRDARRAFDIAQTIGFDFKLLDIGGGFNSHKDVKHTFSDVCSEIRPLLDELFPERSGIRIIAEPGRYMVSSALCLATNVFAKRKLCHGDHSKQLTTYKCSTRWTPEITAKETTVGLSMGQNHFPKNMYYINSGVFQTFLGRSWGASSMRNIDVYNPEAFLGKPRLPCALWGPSCCPIDRIGNDVRLPELDVGDWIIFRDMGEYSTSLFSHFGCYEYPDHIYILRDNQLELSIWRR